jgi:hypothetical protein
MTVREKKICWKILHVIAEYEFDLDSDIEGCDGNQLKEIDAHFRACSFLKKRIRNYLSGTIDNPRGIMNGENPVTKEPKYNL